MAAAVIDRPTVEFAAKRLQNAVAELTTSVLPSTDLPALPQSAQDDLAHVLETLRAVFVDLGGREDTKITKMSSFKRQSIFSSVSQTEFSGATPPDASQTPGGPNLVTSSAGQSTLKNGEAMNDWINKTFTHQPSSRKLLKRTSGKSGSQNKSPHGSARMKNADSHGGGGFILTKGRGLLHLTSDGVQSMSASLRNLHGSETSLRVNASKTGTPLDQSAALGSMGAATGSGLSSGSELAAVESSGIVPPLLKHDYTMVPHALSMDTSDPTFQMTPSMMIPPPEPSPKNKVAKEGELLGIASAPPAASSSEKIVVTTESGFACTKQSPSETSIMQSSMSQSPRGMRDIVEELSKTLTIDRQLPNGESTDATAVLPADVDHAVSAGWFHEVNEALKDEERTIVELHETIDFVPQCPDTINDESFDIFKFHKLHKERTLVQVALNIFFQYPFISRLRLCPVKLANYVAKLEDLYGYVRPYHNALHAADVLWSAHVYLMHQNTRSNFSDMEILAILFAALVHDVGHPGVNNHFLVKTSHPLAILYNDISPNESMHTALAFLLFKAHPETNFFQSVPVTPSQPTETTSNKTSFVGSDSEQEEDKHLTVLGTNEALSVSQQNEAMFENEEEFRELVTQLVIGTDMKHHGTLIQTLGSNLNNGIIGEDDITLLLKAIIHAADLSNPMKPRHVYFKWIERVIAEFWQQGDAERDLGLPVSSHCDRNSSLSVPQTQIGFISFVVKPFMSEIEPLLPPVWMERLEENLQAMKVSEEEQFFDIDRINALSAVPWENNFNTSPFLKMVNKIANEYKDQHAEGALVPTYPSGDFSRSSTVEPSMLDGHHHQPPSLSTTACPAILPRGSTSESPGALDVMTPLGRQLSVSSSENAAMAMARESIDAGLGHLKSTMRRVLEEMKKSLPSRAAVNDLLSEFGHHWSNTFKLPWNDKLEEGQDDDNVGKVLLQKQPSLSGQPTLPDVVVVAPTPEALQIAAVMKMVVEYLNSSTKVWGSSSPFVSSSFVVEENTNSNNNLLAVASTTDSASRRGSYVLNRRSSSKMKRQKSHPDGNNNLAVEQPTANRSSLVGSPLLPPQQGRVRHNTLSPLDAPRQQQRVSSPHSPLFDDTSDLAMASPLQQRQQTSPLFSAPSLHQHQLHSGSINSSNTNNNANSSSSYTLHSSAIILGGLRSPTGSFKSGDSREDSK